MNRYNRALLFPAALLTLAAAAIHFAVAPGHLREYLPYGVAFLLTAIVQAALAVAVVVRPGRAVFAAATAVALGCVAVWAISRTVGLPFGPPEKDVSIQLTDPLTTVLLLLTSSGVAGVVTSFMELISAAIFGVLLWRGPRRKSHGRWWLAAAIPSSVPIALLMLLGVGSALNPLPEAVNMSAGDAVAMSELTEPPGDQQVKDFALTTQVAFVNGKRSWTYNGTVPGPELRVKEGDRVRVHLVNHLPVATTIHWHGYPLPNAEDGVAGVTQDAVKPGDSYTYEFVATIPGTYWYHSHQDTEHQVPMGLYGALIVEPTTGPRYDVDRTVLIGDSDDPDATTRIDAAPGQRVLLRVISAYGEDVTGDPEVLTLVGAPYRIVAIDGHDLNSPSDLGPQRILVDTGQRYDLAFTMPATGQVRIFDTRARTGSRAIRHEWADVGSGALPSTPGGTLPVFDLAHYGVPAPDPVADAARFDVSRDLTISAMVGFRYGSYQFVHIFNGKSFPDSGQILVKRGDLVRLRLVNDTDEYQPVHLHGHVMSVIGKNGARLAGSPVHLDSILVGPHETWEVAFLANNPGLWMLHCHVLIHAAYGLTMMVSYEGISTPYTVGTRSGNFPE